jgi:hypothetical protein
MKPIAESTPRPWSLLAETIGGAIEGTAFASNKFFHRWFRELGTPYFFLFKKNLSVTNIQHSELISLIRQHIHHKATHDHVCDLAFHTTDDFSSTIELIVRPIIENLKFDAEELRRLVALYWPIVERSIVVNQFYTSCAVFLPPHLDLDVLRVCAEAGYVHSCGHSLFVRRLKKATAQHFYESIDRHLERHPEFIGKLQFIPFSSEDFEGDKGQAYMKDALKDGIDGTKIRVGKLYMTRISLVKIFQKMENLYRGRLLFRGAGHYQDTHPKTSDSTLWLISDHTVNLNNRTSPGIEGYYICYHQLFCNESPFRAFDENKPAWIAHNTIPHTLLGAMLNVTKPWPKDRSIIICDPFGGTGTTWLESKKHANTRCITGDISPMFPTLVSDNTTFFSMPHPEIAEHVANLRQLLVALKKADERERQGIPLLPQLFDITDPAITYRKAMEAIALIKEGNSSAAISFDVSAVDTEKLKLFSFFERLIFYIALRAELRFQSAYERGGKDRIGGFSDEANYLIDEMESFVEWCKRVETGEKAVGLFSVFPGHYSEGCAIRYSCLVKAQADLSTSDDVCVRDARGIQVKSCDILVTDPPYGVNTDEDPYDLAKLYAEVIRAMIGAIRNDGHLVICLPIEAYSGRPLPACTASQIITAQILRTATLLGREAYLPAQNNLAMTTPPYYWRSGALRRVILHFRIRDKAL